MKTLHLRNAPYMTGAAPIQNGLISHGIVHVTLRDGTRGTITPDDDYGPITARGCEVAKWRFGYPTSAIHPGNEIAGDQLLGYLHGKPLPAAYAKRAKQRNGPKPPVDHDTEARNRVVAQWRWAIANASRFLYANASDPLVRPFPRFKGPIPAGKRVHTDCTGMIGFVGYRSDTPDPFQLGYRGEGYTGTMLDRMVHIGLAATRLGDCVVWIDPRRPTGHHAAQIIARPATANPVLGSFGSNPPRDIDFEAETSIQARYGATRVAFLRLRTS